MYNIVMCNEYFYSLRVFWDLFYFYCYANFTWYTAFYCQLPPIKSLDVVPNGVLHQIYVTHTHLCTHSWVTCSNAHAASAVQVHFTLIKCFQEVWTYSTHHAGQLVRVHGSQAGITLANKKQEILLRRPQAF